MMLYSRITGPTCRGTADSSRGVSNVGYYYVLNKGVDVFQALSRSLERARVVATGFIRVGMDLSLFLFILLFDCCTAQPHVYCMYTNYFLIDKHG